jgi:hypothetical protein
MPRRRRRRKRNLPARPRPDRLSKLIPILPDLTRAVGEAMPRVVLSFVAAVACVWALFHTPGAAAALAGALLLVLRAPGGRGG